MRHIQVWAVLPSRRALLTAALSSFLGGAVATGYTSWIRHPGGPPLGPHSPYDPHFIPIGRAYLPELGKAYAVAWDEGAESLDAGQDFSSALGVVAKVWEMKRVGL